MSLLLTATAWSRADSTPSAATAQSPAAQPVPPPAVASGPSNPSAPADAPKETPSKATPIKPKTPPSLAESKAIEEAKREHVRGDTDQVRMDTPPPPLRTEKKSPLPAPGLVWVPGHWTPVEGKWQWTAGEWGIPATPVSVWIDASYDPKTKHWSPGYWQPDRIQPYESEKSDKEQPATQKFL